MSETTGLIATTINLFTSPTTAFKPLKTKGSPWFPILVTLGINALVTLLYFSSVDMSWMIDQAVLSGGEDMSPAQKEGVRDTYNSMGANGMMIVAVIFSSIFILFMYLIFALYYLIVSNIRNDNLSFSNGFTLVCWTNLVGLVSALVGMTHIFLSDDGKIPQSSLRGLNINELFFQVDISDSWYNWLSSIDLTGIWAAILGGICYKVWTKSSTLSSMIIGFLPTILFFGIWALLK